MMPGNKSPGRYYQLFKLHKEHSAGTLPPERPIISQSGSITEAISLFIDHHSKDMVPKIESYIQDTPDFLRKLEEINDMNIIDSSTFPVSLDVKGLYLNIPQEEGIECFQDALNTRTNQTIPTEYLIKLLRIVLYENIFTFDETLYRQVVGTAMGTRVAPTFANIFMKIIDLKITMLASKSYKNALLILKRFIDDIFILWKGTEESLLKFMEDINKLHPSMKFTATYNLGTKSTTFLDTRVQIFKNRLSTDLYRKETDKVQYLLPSSSHPAHVTKNIPYSLALCLVRICSEQSYLMLRTEELRSMLLSRKYSKRIIDKAIADAVKIPRAEALEKAQPKELDRITFVVTYSPFLPSISKIIQKHWKSMTMTPELKTIFQAPPMVAFRQPGNLKKDLCRARLPPPAARHSYRLQTESGLRRCLKSGCKMCSLVNESSIIASNSTSTSHVLKGLYTCETSSVVYIITCKKCNLAYIGQTGRALKKRIQEHLQYVANNTEATGKHFRSHGHSLSHMSVQVIEQVQPESKMHRLTRENMWIQRLCTREPTGLNKIE